MEDTMNSELCSAGKSLMAQINHKWPSRDTSKDNFTNNTIEISEYMFGEGRGKEQAQELADELNAYRNDKKDGGRLEEITCEDGLHIVFAKEDAEDYSPFKLKIFRFFDDSPNDPQFDKEFVLKKQQLLSKTGFLKDSNPTGEYDSNTDSATREALKKMVSDSPKKNWPKEFSPGGFMPNYPGKDVLKYGQNNDDVKEIQMHLINKGFLTDCAPTGEYNDYTADAVKNFIFRMTKQESDGKHVDEPTWRRIIGGYTGKWLNG
jgi:hypothetical protein